MPGGLGPRFALEAGFLILLAAVAAYARLDATEIILVMAGGWVLASIFEVLAARRERLYPGATWERGVETDEAPASSKDEAEPERRLSWFRRPAEVAVPPTDEVAAPEHAPQPEAAPPREPTPQPEPAPPPEPAPAASIADDESTGEIELPKRRRWFRRGRPGVETPAVEVEVRPSARHVRLIRNRSSEETDPVPSEGDTERKDAEAGP